MKTKTRITPKETLDSKNEIRLDYKVDYFYRNFIKKNKYIDSLEGKRKKDKVLTYTQYRLIIKTYLKIYFYEVFYINRPLYFCLTGKLIRVRNTAFTLERTNVKISAAITIVWYLKFFKSMDSHCVLKLLRGSSSTLSKIRQQWAKENDLGMLPMIITKRKELINNNLMFNHDDKRTIFFRSNT